WTRSPANGRGAAPITSCAPSWTRWWRWPSGSGRRPATARTTGRPTRSGSGCTPPASSSRTPRTAPDGPSSNDPALAHGLALPGRAVSGDSPAGRGGRAKSGKPRVGTGGKGRRQLEGKGPTPPAHMRPGHPAQRRAEAAARGATTRGGTRRAGQPGPEDEPRNPASGGARRGGGPFSAKKTPRRARARGGGGGGGRPDAGAG